MSASLSTLGQHPRQQGGVFLSVFMTTVRFVRCRKRWRQQPLYQVVSSHELVRCGNGKTLCNVFDWVPAVVFHLFHFVCALSSRLFLCGKCPFPILIPSRFFFFPTFSDLRTAPGLLCVHGLLDLRVSMRTATMDTSVYRYVLCGRHSKSFFQPVDIQHTQCPCRLFQSFSRVVYAVLQINKLLGISCIQ